MSRNFTPEETLVDNLLLNDTEAFEELHHRYCISLYNYCIDKLNSPEDAKRIVREIFVSLWENRHTLPVGFSVSIHLYKEVRRKVIECISNKLGSDKNTVIIKDEVIPGFRVMQLQKARQPVKTVFKERTNIQTAMIHKINHENNKKRNSYFDTVVLKNLLYAFQKITHLW